MTSFAVLISGRGTNMAAIARAVAGNRLKARLKFVASDNPGAAGLDVARKFGYRAEILDYEKEGRSGAERQLVRLCSLNKVEWIVLAGFMRILSLQNSLPPTEGPYREYPPLSSSSWSRDGIGDAWKYGVKVHRSNGPPGGRRHRFRPHSGPEGSSRPTRRYTRIPGEANPQGGARTLLENPRGTFFRSHRI